MKRQVACLVFLVAFVIVVPSQGKDRLEQFFKDVLGMTFAVYPVRPSDGFGVGAIVSGRGKSLIPVCFVDKCLPEKLSLIERGVIKQDEFPWHKRMQYRTSNLFFKALGLSLDIKTAKNVEVEFEGCVQEQIDIATANRLWGEHMTAEAKDFLKDRKGGRKELVSLALRCDALKFTFHDDRGVTVPLPFKSSVDAKWTRLADDKGAIVNAWIAFQSLTLEEPVAPEGIRNWKRPRPMFSDMTVPGNESGKKPSRALEFTRSKARLGYETVEISIKK